MEVLVTNSNPDSQLHFVRKFAKDLVVVFAFHLAETISALFRHVLDHPSKVLYDPETEPLFLPLFWFYPIYREMLNSASRHRPSKSMELRRAASGLVKVICRTEESRPGGKGLKPGKPKKGLLASFGDWFGSINMMNILYIWFPEWRDLLQSRRQFWPTLTTRHASLVPVSAEALQRERRQMQAKHLCYNLDIRWVDLEEKLEVLAPTGLTRDDIWRRLFLTKQRKNPYVEGCYTGEDLEDVKRQWEAKKVYFLDYKKDGTRPPCIDLATALQGFGIDNTAAQHAIEGSKALHARRWQTKDGIYRIKRQALPDVRDAPLDYDNAAASSTNANPRWRNWDEDYAMGYQLHP